jgi:hypothetical protein
MNENTGGPAFPVGLEAFGEDKTGMTLKDYFAAKAMQAIISNSDQTSISFDEVGDWVGSYAYEVANSMLKARES